MYELECPTMNVKQAKDFLVGQAIQQAALENVPLSKLEIRMMYFTETEDATEDPIQLNDEFEAEYDSADYEAKISRLLHDAHARVKKENPKTLRQWAQSIRFLRKEDHYILVLWDQGSPTRHPAYRSLSLIKPISILVLIFIGFAAFLHHYGTFSGRGNRRPGQAPDQATYIFLPWWLKYLFLSTLAGIYFYSAILPFILKRQPLQFQNFVANLFRSSSKK